MGQTTVALLGTGAMGAGMAKNIAAAGLPLRVWNRTRARAEPLAEVGAVVADTAAAAADGADVVVTMQFDLDSVVEVISAAAPAPGTVWIQSATVGIDGAAQLAELAAERGLVYVDAPVLGTRKPAEDGTLVVLASGPDDAHERCAPVFDAIGSRTLWVGTAGQGSRLKLVANLWVTTATAATAEVLSLAGALGLDPSLFFRAVEGGGTDMPYIHLKGGAMLGGDFAPSFTVEGAAKDTRLIVEAAAENGLELPVARAVAGQFEASVEAGHADLDMAAAYLNYRDK
ncbi:NAD(P)-dependent oxidoreductase [Cryptosporangium arvum]|uniref:Beta-hydroxyacid dehydrogenase, 3-hydroxyisobutyrate dehydrogenase n=1 Tax=Cryptosporangium arvum DSM 44712 TaxID=927661 RepID=A0A010YVC8_9ACTN|nr:NAD(P)-dependent oxidoreductase [Cryptosporangium arvum]EXG79108.1 beta-hydroxyacid dehydrogenase, 3-hydroxyisobutyrate dehydrogenase [Cryptosporangium arvum DSM 44712]